jgi:hypothetical protein
MKNLSWIRADTQNYPLIYSVFEADVADGEKITFRIEDLHEERFDEAIELMKGVHFKQPMLSSKRIQNDEVSMAEIIESWKEILQQKISLVCYEENSNEIIGLCFLSVITEQEFDEKPKGEVNNEVNRVVRFIKDIFFNPFENYEVDQILTGAATYVNEKFVAFNIEAEMLKVRAEVGKLFQINITSELFSTEISQNAAAASGYEENFSIDYKKLPKLICEGFFPGIKEEKLKIMSMKIKN